ncbi:MAG: hypothetical protein IJC07_04100 [Clostridia bacterium]|nr:hypothetical protein [Clostridia bacterium]
MQKELIELEKRQEEKRKEELVSEVISDFNTRREERKIFERQWEMNMNFLAGKQYCNIDGRGELIDENKEFYWQDRGVYNHIAPIIESRLAKLSRVKPTVYVRPKSDDDRDVNAASNSEKIISSVFKMADMECVVKKVTEWSETCGTGFYKVVWDSFAGNEIAKIGEESVYNGNVKIIPVSPFEIFPDNLYSEQLSGCSSIIHARVMSVDDVYKKYGVRLVGEKVNISELAKVEHTSNSKKQTKAVDNSVIVIERYERPTVDRQNGRLVTVAGGKLLYEGEMPYVNGVDKNRTFPFVKQVSIGCTGNFFGKSVIERLIPVQRAFNAVKNRKHEFLNRLCMGVVTVEDGAVDVDDLASDGLSPGKVLVYRQGYKAPELMNETAMPDEFDTEEEKLRNEFVTISGVSDVSSSSKNANLSSASALELLIEQDNSRMTSTAEEIRQAYLETAKQTIRLYGQFMVGLTAVRYHDKGDKVRVFYAGKDDFQADDVYLESENELMYSTAQKREMVFKLYSSGLLHDENGKLRVVVKEKLLGLLGYKDLDYQKGVSRLQEEKALSENEKMRKVDVAVEEIDDHSIHVDEHVRYVLCEYESLLEEQKQRYYAHIRAHKEQIKQNQENKGE